MPTPRGVSALESISQYRISGTGKGAHGGIGKSRGQPLAEIDWPPGRIDPQGGRGAEAPPCGFREEGRFRPIIKKECCNIESLINEIAKLRGGRPLAVDHRNSNRYRLISFENGGSRTAYCFGVPIYNRRTRKLVSLKFQNAGDVSHLSGSNAEITLAQEALLEDEDGSCRVSLPAGPAGRTEKSVRYASMEIRSTLNGIVCKADCMSGNAIAFTLTAGRPFMNVRANDKYFALMNEEYRPFVTVSCIGTADGSGRIIAPAEIRYQKNSDSEFSLQLLPKSPLGRSLAYEINLYEQKLFQDTTVESKNPQSNNAFGGTAFIGETAAYGEQWLYLRPEFSRIPEMFDRRIDRAILHFPQYNRSDAALTAFRLSSRFCSFGSNWENKVEAAQAVTHSAGAAGYQSIDCTDLVTDRRSGSLIRSEGLILKTKVKGSGFTAVAIGDSYYAPPVFEFSFR